MDPSALIFIALALAWACYLIPKALEQHDEGSRSRSIDGFSHRLRVLARREPSGRRRTELVTAAEAAAASSVPVAAAPRKPKKPKTVKVPVEMTPALVRARRRARAVAARRRRRMLDLLVLANVVVAALALLSIVQWHWQGVPAGLVVLWLIVCRVSVRRARRPLMERVVVDAPVAAVSDGAVQPAPSGEAQAVVEDNDVTEEIAVVREEPRVVGGWDLQPVVVPTYIAKDMARRSVRTIDLDSTGVWSSGRSAADSALVRDNAAAPETAAEPSAAAASGE